MPIEGRKTIKLNGIIYDSTQKQTLKQTLKQALKHK